MNPRNVEASAARRVKLLAAFDSLPEDDRADLLELAEDIDMAGMDTARRLGLREAIAALYAAAGWDS
jgi:hypothetical protein